MKAETYASLLRDLQKLQKSLVASQIATVRRDATLAARLARLHNEAEVGGSIDDFVATTARKSTVLFLLRTVFVRVLEDLAILELKRIRGDWGFAAFREVAPALDHRAYFRFVFRDLAIDFPALFAPGEDELPLPDEDGCVEVWELWHHPNREGEHYVWNGDGFDSRFLGDLYQDLDKDIRKRFALLQTPRFVEQYILDHTLTPALVEFDPAALRAKGKTFCLIDPTCGSGHFLISAFRRLADYWRDRHGLGDWDACERALESVWGCDINPHAVDIADFRLLLEVVARTSVKDLDRLAAVKLNLRTMDSLIPWERSSQQSDLYPAKDRLDAYATVKQRSENAVFLGRDFHVVVGNPPYINPKDARKRADYRIFWPDSACGRYGLSAPFAERLFDIGTARAYVGQITANSFMKCEFGKRLVRVALKRFCLSGVIDASGAFIPGHGTPTVILFGRCMSASESVWAVLGKRGEPRRPAEPAKGHVWSAIAAAQFGECSDNSPFVTTALVPAQTFHQHPWSLGGGEVSTIKEMMESAGTHLSRVADSFGNLTKMIEDELYFEPSPSVRMDNNCKSVTLLEGEYVRDWHAQGLSALYPYDYGAAEPKILDRTSAAYQHFWRARAALWERRSRASKFAPLRTISGAQFYEYPFYAHGSLHGLGICFPEIATHNHFVLDHGGKLFKQTAPVIKLNATASIEDHLDILGSLNSSIFGFWCRQVFKPKSGSGIGRGIQPEGWMERIQFDSTKLKRAPLVDKERSHRVDLARALHDTAIRRARSVPSIVLADWTATESNLAAQLADAKTRFAADTRMMVALQEEIDWLAYRAYGVIDDIDVLLSNEVEPLSAGHRAFEIIFARSDDEAEDEDKSDWWRRNGHERSIDIPGGYSPRLCALLQQRIELIEEDSRIALLESAPYKRRWQVVDWAREVERATEAWLLERLEVMFKPGSNGAIGGPLARPRPYRLEEIVSAWSRDPQVAIVAGIWAGTGAVVDLSAVAESLLNAHALPDNSRRVYTDEGLRKLEQWKRTWAVQDQEDAWEAAVAKSRTGGDAAPTKRLVDPDDASAVLSAVPLSAKFTKADYSASRFFSIRREFDVPREHFVLFAELSPPRFGWNGWRVRDRALAQVEAFTLAENDPQQPLPVPTTDDPRRCGVTLGLWESLPDVKRWGSADEHAELLSLAQEACRQSRCPCPVLDAWKAQVLRGEAVGVDGLVALSNGKGKAKTKVTKSSQSNGATDGGSEQSVSLPERAWIATLLEAGKDIDLAAIWALHRRRIDEAAAAAAAAASESASKGQLRFTNDVVPAEVRSLDEAQLAIVVDDLVASGDLEARGRGKKKRYQLVPRGTRA